MSSNIARASAGASAPRPVRARVLAYGAAVLFVALATVVRLALTPLWGPSERPLIFYFAAVIASAWVGRIGPALLCTGLGACVAAWAFMPPVFELRIARPVDGSVMAVFVIISVFGTLVVHGLHRSRDRVAAETRRGRQLEDRFGKAFRASPDGMAISRRSDGLLVEVNPRWLEIFGLAQEQVVGRTTAELCVPAEPGGRMSLLGRIESEGRVRDHEMEVLRADGQRRRVVVSVEPIHLGEEPALISIVRDVTVQHAVQVELRAARDEAVRANRVKDDFLAMLSHELRTPLNPVLLLASEGAQDPRCPAEFREDFATIARNISVEARLIDDLLDLSRLERGKLPLQLQALPMHPILQEVCGSVQTECTAKGIAFSADFQADRCTVSADPVRLRQVFWNLLSNAVKFTPAGGSIRVETRNSVGAAAIELVVRDTGIGMTPEEIGRAFRPFEQGDHAAREPHAGFGGLGLGLAIAESLVTRLGGTIRLDSEGIGKGTTVLVGMPLVEVSPECEEGGTGLGADAEPPAPPLKVLLVDDHEPTRVVMARLLGRRGYSVTTAGSYADAQAAARREAFALLVSDLGLPDGDGCRLFSEMRKTQPDLRAIALSGYGMESDLERSHAAGFLQHLVKPVNASSLDEALRVALANHV